MAVDVVRAELLRDVTSRTPQQVIDAQARNVFTQLQFLTTSNVPRHMTDSLSKLVTGIDSSPDFPDMVVANYGVQDSSIDGGIELNYATEDPDASRHESDNPDITGAEYGLMQVLVRFPNPLPDYVDAQTVEDTHLRINYVIDNLVRQLRRPNPLNLSPVGVDNSIDPTLGVKCRRLRFAKATNALESISIFKLDFIRIYGA